MNDRVTSKPRYLYELADLYQVSKPTMRRWLEWAGIDQPAAGRLYSIAQLTEFVRRFGEP